MDVILLDFAKAFDITPYQRLLLKLNFYGILDHTLQWISSFYISKNTKVHCRGEHIRETGRFVRGPTGNSSRSLLF